GSPDPSISADTFTARWTGMVQPQFSQTYTFYTTTDDGVRLWVNGQLLVNAWVNQGPTTWSGSIALKGQQYYNIQMDYYENAGGAQAALAWSSPSAPQVIIPQSQLYPATNPPPSVSLVAPTNGSVLTASASVTLSASAAALNNAVAEVDFYANGSLLGSVTNSPFTLTFTGLAAGAYSLTAVALDTTGLSATSAPVSITVNAGTGQPYGLNSRGLVNAFLNMPMAGTGTGTGTLPLTLSQTGVFTNTASLTASSGLIPYSVNVPLWSDGAVKTRWMAVPNGGAPYTPGEQIAFAPAGEWTFPSGTVFIKHFELVTNEADPNAPKRRLETRLLVRNNSGSVYGLTYRWRADNSDADLLSTSLSEDIAITNATGVRTQSWYYPSPADCLLCHTPAASYVLGVKTRQLNGPFTYPTGTNDNQLRTLNRLGLLSPAIDEAAIGNLTALAPLTNASLPLVDRARSYLDANCSQCHRPGGGGPTFDARYDTPLTNQNLINGVLAKGSLGFDNAKVVVAQDLWRSILYQRAASSNASVKMPPLSRNVADTNSLAVVAAWINSLPGIPALAPPTINPNGGSFNGLVNVSLVPPTNAAALYYTLDGSLPTTNSLHYVAPFALSSNATVCANAFAGGFNNSVAASAVFTILPNLVFSAPGGFTNGLFQVQLNGVAGRSYVLQASTNLVTWVPLSTNVPVASPFTLSDPGATNYPRRFYRAVQLP
ncbi:MAG: hypothetical protein JWR26_1417, partial [Pedosphaera sp.]|nr:hypothetical protein [Pedosphaera sp.]